MIKHTTTRRLAIVWCGLLVLLGGTVPVMCDRLPDPSPSSLPRWRGFNLLNKFSRDWSNRPFEEEDFQTIRELGFNFVRLPMDYRTWIEGDDWTRFDEDSLKEIDDAVRWGQQYEIHVCICFHRAPGYTVAAPPEPLLLWTNSVAQEACAIHWATFARRYREVPSRYLSFDLVNEPAAVTAEAYSAVIRQLVAAIRQEDADRLIVADGLDYGTLPVTNLVGTGVAQSTRGYVPFRLTHHRAPWVEGTDQWPVPCWPMQRRIGEYLYGPKHPGLTGPLTLRGKFNVGTRVIIDVDTVSDTAVLEIRSGDELLTQRRFESRPPADTPLDTNTVYNSKWETYERSFNTSVTATLTRVSGRVSLEVADGDWLTFSRIIMQDPRHPPERELVMVPEHLYWGARQSEIWVADGSYRALVPEFTASSATLQLKHIRPWQELEKRGVGIMVGEWGAFNRVPHATTLAWMEDCLWNWRQAGWGWALWNLHGPFGIFDSDRLDVDYIDYRGHKLDRRMLELLQRY